MAHGWTALLALAALPLAVALAVAAEPIPPSRGNQVAFAQFNALDRDQDRKLSPTELAMAGTSVDLLAILDANDDGTLSMEDGAPARRLVRWRANGAGDGRRLGGADMAALAPSEIFAALDADGDGFLSPLELRISLWGSDPVRPSPPVTQPPENPLPSVNRPCWFLQGQGRWIELPPWAPACRAR